MSQRYTRPGYKIVPEAKLALIYRVSDEQAKSWCVDQLRECWDNRQPTCLLLRDVSIGGHHLPNQEHLRGRAEPEPSRPELPESYGVSYRTSSAEMLPWSRVNERLERARNYWVGTTRPDGRPHAVPVWGVWLDEAFYFGTDRHSRKGRNLATNPGLVVHLESGDDVVILEGVAEEVADPSLLARIGDVYAAKYELSEGIPATAVVYTLRPRVAHAWLESNFVESATRWLFGRG